MKSHAGMWGLDPLAHVPNASVTLRDAHFSAKRYRRLERRAAQSRERARLVFEAAREAEAKKVQIEVKRGAFETLTAKARAMVSKLNPRRFFTRAASRGQ